MVILNANQAAALSDDLEVLLSLEGRRHPKRTAASGVRVSDDQNSGPEEPTL